MDVAVQKSKQQLPVGDRDAVFLDDWECGHALQERQRFKKHGFASAFILYRNIHVQLCLDSWRSWFE